MIVSRCVIRDITETEAIPKGSVVSVEDYDSCAHLYVIQWHGRIYLASPDELIERPK